MRDLNVKIKFDTNSRLEGKPGVLTLSNYEKKVRTDIKRGKGGTHMVFLKHLMTRSDMDRSVLELCERISQDGHPPIPFGSIARHYTIAGEPNCEEKVVEACYQFVV